MPSVARTSAYCVLLALIPICSRGDAAGPVELAIWPGNVPGETGDAGDEMVLPKGKGKPVIRITNVTGATIHVFQAPAEINTGAAVLVCPGGAYQILAWDLEGTEVAEWLNSIGVTAIVLKYRVPRRKGRPKHLAPLQDAQRAMSLVRSRADEWNIDPNRIGILGFSAGGHLSATTATNSDRRAYDPVDEIDKVSCRPDFVVLVYPAYLLDERNDDEMAPEIRVSKTSPPVFFAHAGNDNIGPQNSIRMYLALKQAAVPAELHVYASGGHGFGLRKTDSPSCRWPESCERWLRDLGLLKKKGAP